jgi:hypothetical protein
MSIKSKLLPAVLAALMMVSGSLFALTAEETAQLELDMEKDMKALLLTGVSFENAVEKITKKYGAAMQADPVAAKAMFSAINTVAKAQGIKTDSPQYAKVIKTASVEMKVLNIPATVVSDAAVSANVPVNVVTKQIPTKGTVTAGKETGTQQPQLPQVAIGNTSSNTGGSASSPAG